MESHLHWLPIAAWVVLTSITFAIVDMSSLGGWSTLLAALVIPPMLLFRLWNNEPSPTVAEIIRATEDRR